MSQREEPTLTCERVELLLPDHLGGALGPVSAASVESHLESCAACARARREIEGIEDLFARDRTVHPAEVAEARLHLRRALGSMRRGVSAPSFIHHPYVQAAARAAAFVLMVFLLRPVAQRWSALPPVPPVAPDPDPALLVDMFEVGSRMGDWITGASATGISAWFGEAPQRSSRLLRKLQALDFSEVEMPEGGMMAPPSMNRPPMQMRGTGKSG